VKALHQKSAEDEAEHGVAEELEALVVATRLSGAACWRSSGASAPLRAKAAFGEAYVLSRASGSRSKESSGAAGDYWCGGGGRRARHFDIDAG
jgi:hypothetical protein